MARAISKTYIGYRDNSMIKHVTVTFDTDGTNMDDDIEETIKDLLSERLTEEQYDTIVIIIE